MNIPPQAYLLNHINQNWIDSINHQIEENGKSLLESINRVKKKNANNMSAIAKKRRKSKQGRPQSTNYINIPQPQGSTEAFRAMLNKRFGSEFIGTKHIDEQDASEISNNQISNHNKSYNHENTGFRRKEMDPDLTEAQIFLNHKYNIIFYYSS